MGTIYVLTNRVNQKKYVGQTRGKVHQRLFAHRHSVYLIGEAIAEYGWGNFDIEKFEFPNYDLEAMEIKFISTLGSLVPHGYNLTSGGRGVRDITEATRKKKRLAKLGKKRGPHSEETKSKMRAAPHRMPEGFGETIRKALTGRRLSEEHKQHIGLSHKGKKHSNEWSRKIGEAQVGPKNHNFGKHPWNYGLRKERIA